MNKKSDHSLEKMVVKKIMNNYILSLCHIFSLSHMMVMKISKLEHGQKHGDSAGHLPDVLKCSRQVYGLRSGEQLFHSNEELSLTKFFKDWDLFHWKIYYF